MLWNATAMEILPLYLNKLVPEFVAILLSVTLVLFVGEIIPSAIMTGPNQLKIASGLSGLVKVVLVVFFPLAYPLSLLLDFLLGHNEGVNIYNRTELRTMINIQQEEQGKRGHSEDHGVNLDEVAMISGVLSFREAVVGDVMTKESFTMSIEEKLNLEVV